MIFIVYAYISFNTYLQPHTPTLKKNSSMRHDIAMNCFTVPDLKKNLRQPFRKININTASFFLFEVVPEPAVGVDLVGPVEDELLRVDVLEEPGEGFTLLLRAELSPVIKTP